MEYWRHYLIGQKFLVRTDHAALQWLKKSKDTSKLMARWLSIIENSNINLDTDIISRMNEHDFTIIHREGKHHTNADALSRIPVTQELEQINQINITPTLAQQQDLDPEISVLK